MVSIHLARQVTVQQQICFCQQPQKKWRAVKKDVSLVAHYKNVFLVNWNARRKQLEADRRFLRSALGCNTNLLESSCMVPYEVNVASSNWARLEKSTTEQLEDAWLNQMPRRWMGDKNKQIANYNNNEMLTRFRFLFLSRCLVETRQLSASLNRQLLSHTRTHTLSHGAPKHTLTLVKNRVRL